MRAVFAGLLAGLLAIPAQAWALESAAVQTRHATVALVSDTDAIEPGKPFGVGLSLRLAPGWHTYWRNPGDAGVAPELTFQLPPDSAVGPIAWPAPQRVAEGDITTFAYQADVLLPVRVTPGSAPLTLQAHASWLVCRDVCVPEEGDFTLSLPAGVAGASPQSGLFAAAASQTPAAAPFQAAIAPDGAMTLSGPLLPRDAAKAEFFPAADGATETAGAQAPVRHGEDLVLQLRLAGSKAAAGPVEGVLVFTAAGGARTAYAIAAVPGAQAPAPAQAAWLLLLGAFAGGLLLNLMPCVFPVLAMKAMALARFSQADRRTIRAEAASYTAGVVAAFVMLGAVLLVLRTAGQAVGWGFQFQSPVFVTAIAWVLFATGLNLSGVFAVGEGWSGAGQGLAARRGHVGSVFTGLLAVVVATPCTAAFMGAAVAGALAAPAGTALSVFAAMGLGLACPYAAFAVFPRLATLLPRPGQWMATLRQGLAFPMYGAAAWLVWVVSQQTGPAGVLTAAAGLVGIGFAAWALGVAQAATGRGRAVGYAAAACAAVLTVFLVAAGGSAPAEPSEPFSPSRLAELRGEGRPVFVNMTAAWCLSCLVNERLALSPAAVRIAFAQAHVAYLKGDWTRQDPAISAYLRGHDRDGVPLYVFYPPGRAPIILPQLLTEGALLDQVAKLGT